MGTLFNNSINGTGDRLSFGQDSQSSLQRPLKISKTTVGGVFNIGAGKEISIGDLAGNILHLMGKDIPITCQNERLRPEKSEVERLCADNTKAKEILHWEPK